jgi:hypothetical protein
MMPPLIEHGAKSWTRIEQNIVVLSLHFKMEDHKDKSPYSLLYDMMVNMTVTRPRRRYMTLAEVSQVRMVSMGLSLHLWRRMELRASRLPLYD